MNPSEFRIEGMTCGGCEQSVLRTISAIPEVAAVQVNRAQQQALVSWKEGLTPQAQGQACQSICAAVEAAGFDCALA